MERDVYAYIFPSEITNIRLWRSKRHAVAACCRIYHELELAFDELVPV